MVLIKLVFVLVFTRALGFVPRAWNGALRGRVVSNVVAGGESRAVIVQNEGGGHGEIGYHLALKLAKEKGIKVTLLQAGDREENRLAEPWDSYGDLEAAGVDVKWADLKDPQSAAQALEGCGAFEFVFDNWARGPNQALPLVELAKSWDCSNYVFVSTAGMYKGASQPMTEDDPVLDTGQGGVETLLAAEGLPWTSFRPQYIYGPKANKRTYLDWFFDRAARGLPMPIPGKGDQVISLTNAVDVASLIVSALGNPKAEGQVFNCATDAKVTLVEICDMVTQMAGYSLEMERLSPAEMEKEATSLRERAKDSVEKAKMEEQLLKEMDAPPKLFLMRYNPSDIEKLDKGMQFPFRNTPFYVDVTKAKQLLGWTPKHNLKDDLEWYFADYKARGFDLTNIDIPLDEMVWTASQFTDTIETFQEMLKKMEDNASAELTEKVESLLPR